jgi:hypothetical protein
MMYSRRCDAGLYYSRTGREGMGRGRGGENRTVLSLNALWRYNHDVRAEE